MTTIDPAELLTVTQAAARRGTTRQAVGYLVRQGKLKTVEIAGRQFIRRADLDNYKPGTGGRPFKTNASATAPATRAKRATKKGRAK